MGELRAEAQARSSSDVIDPAARSELLRDVVNRKLLAQEARRSKLDQEIYFVLARRRAEEVLLATLLQRKLTLLAEPPSEAEIAQFTRDNPAAFASQTVFQIEQIDISDAVSAELRDRLGKANSLEEVDEMLTSAGILWQRSRTEWNSNFMPAELATKLRQLPPGKLFIQHDAGRTLAAVVLTAADTPLHQRTREILIRKSLIQQRVSAEVDRRMDLLRASAQIKVQSGFSLAVPAR